MADNNDQIKIVRTLTVIATTVIALLVVGISMGAYRTRIDNNTEAVKRVSLEVEDACKMAVQNEKDIIKIRSAVERTDERTGDIKKSLERIEGKLDNN